MPLVIGNALTISGGITVTSVVLSGDQLYDTPGTYSWTAPDGVRSVSVVCIGGGGAGSRGDSPSVNQVRTGADGSAYALYEPWLGGWTTYSPDLGIVAQWLYTGSRYQW